MRRLEEPHSCANPRRGGESRASCGQNCRPRWWKLSPIFYQWGYYHKHTNSGFNLCKPRSVYDKQNNRILMGNGCECLQRSNYFVLTESPQNDPKTGQETIWGGFLGSDLNEISKGISPSHQICLIASGTHLCGRKRSPSRGRSFWPQLACARQKSPASKNHKT